MNEIKGFQQPDPKGNDMSDKSGLWKIYARGRSFRVGKQTWWGIRWATSSGPKGGRSRFQTTSMVDAEIKLKKKNDREKEKQEYSKSKWEVKK